MVFLIPKSKFFVKSTEKNILEEIVLKFSVKLTTFKVFKDVDTILSNFVIFTNFFFSNWVVLKSGIDFLPRAKTNTKFQYLISIPPSRPNLRRFDENLQGNVHFY